MPCTVCSAWPTWADLSECAKPNCPWELNPGLPIPPLPKSLRDAPLHRPVSPPAPVTPAPATRGPLPAVITLDGAPVHSYASLTSGAARPEPVELAPATPVAKPVPAPVPKAAPKPRFSSRQIEADYNDIMRAVDAMNWSGNSGPTCHVQTRLEWKNRGCRELYLAVKHDLHDQAFGVGKRTLYYYIGAIGNWGKAGFRISGHSKPLSRIKGSTTCGILHVENS
jgi:hypothetical protein